MSPAALYFNVLDLLFDLTESCFLGFARSLFDWYRDESSEQHIWLSSVVCSVQFVCALSMLAHCDLYQAHKLRLFTEENEPQGNDLKKMNQKI
jgi:hypothetical protein